MIITDAMQVFNDNSLTNLPDFLLIEMANQFDTVSIISGELSQDIDDELSNRCPTQELLEYQEYQNHPTDEGAKLPGVWPPV